MGKRERPAPAPPPAAPFNAPFAGLAGRLAGGPAAAPGSPAPGAAPAAEGTPATPAGGAPAPRAGPASAVPPSAASGGAAPARTPSTPSPGPPRAVVRMERSGRGGKTVTVVEKLALRPRELEAWCSELKRALGCGGAVEGGALVVQGDARERVARWLEGRGVRKVTVG